MAQVNENALKSKRRSSLTTTFIALGVICCTGAGPIAVLANKVLVEQAAVQPANIELGKVRILSGQESAVRMNVADLERGNQLWAEMAKTHSEARHYVNIQDSETQISSFEEAVRQVAANGPGFSMGKIGNGTKSRVMSQGQLLENFVRVSCDLTQEGSFTKKNVTKCAIERWAVGKSYQLTPGI